LLISPLIQNLMAALKCLPGVGPKSAQRMAFNILERNRDAGLRLSALLQEAIHKVKNCESCRILCEETICRLCSHHGRDRSILCVVETPADVLALEQAGGYRGQYFVLMGRLSPLDGIGPDAIGMGLFQERLKEGHIKEVILATNPTVEGEATAHYIAELVKARNIRATRIAHGVPFGGELEYLDGGTLARALLARLVV